jgi:hypothetical protein
MQTDGRMDMTKLIVAFRNFANAPNNCIVLDLRRNNIASPSGICTACAEILSSPVATEELC